MSEPLVDLTLSLGHARSVSDACDLHNRLHLGQVRMVGELVRLGGIKVRDDLQADGCRRATTEECDEIDAKLAEIARILGHRGGSFGVGAQALDQPPRRTYEAHKALDKALWDHTNPGETWNVASTGIGPRYAEGPAPVAAVSEAVAS